MIATFLTNAILTGLVSSLIAAFITWFFSYLYNKKWYRERYGKLTDTYKGYGYKEDSPEWELEDKPQSEATVTYIGKNTLNIVVTSLNKHNRYIWTGTIYMESENHGSISWNYIKWGGKSFGEKYHKYGYKKVTLIEVENNIYFYLSPEQGDGFKKAVFIKNR